MKSSEKIAIIYHSLFHYALSKEELVRWRAGSALKLIKDSRVVIKTNNPQAHISEQKLLIAKRAANVLSKIPTITFVGVTGSLSMKNAKKNSDIDLMIIVKRDTIWITRVLARGILLVSGFGVREPKNKTEKDLLCLNLWLDHSTLSLPHMPRNVYTAHEIAQVVPLMNKNKTYEQWLSHHKWIEKYWPNAVDIKKTKSMRSTVPHLVSAINHVFYNIQHRYMLHKMTRESVSLNHAYFHPFDWGSRVVKLLQEKHIDSDVVRE